MPPRPSSRTTRYAPMRRGVASASSLSDTADAPPGCITIRLLPAAADRCIFAPPRPMPADLTATDRDDSGSAPESVPAAQLFAVLRCDDLSAPPSRHSLAHIDEVLLARGDDYAVERRVQDGVRQLGRRVPDRRRSRSNARRRRGSDGWQLEDLGSSNGSPADGTRTSAATLADGTWFELGHTLFRLRARLPTPATASGDLRADELD